MGFEPHLHWTFANEHVLLPSITLHSFSGFAVACLLTAVVCLSERFATALLDAQWAPPSLRLSRVSIALWRTGLYSLATFLRLCYMLISMSFHLGLIVTIVLTLSAAQLVIELRKQPRPPFASPRSHNPYDTSSQPLLSDEESQHSHAHAHSHSNYPPSHLNYNPHHNHTHNHTHNFSTTNNTTKTRPRSKSKPEAIFIHPAQNNIARADAVALELGIAGSTERVAQSYSYTKEEPPWEMGRGKDMAREMLLGGTGGRGGAGGGGMAQRITNANKRSSPSPPRSPFYINDSDSDVSSQ